MGIGAHLLYFEEGVCAVTAQANLGWRGSSVNLLGPHQYSIPVVGQVTGSAGAGGGRFLSSSVFLVWQRNPEVVFCLKHTFLFCVTNCAEFRVFVVDDCELLSLSTVDFMTGLTDYLVSAL